MKTHTKSSGPLHDARKTMGLSQKEVAQRAGLKSWNPVWSAEAGKLPPNHPLLPLIARALDVAFDVAVNHQRVKPMSENQVARAAARLSANGNGKHSKSTALVRARVVVPSPRLVAAVARHGGRGKLAKKFDKDVRQCARALITTTNFHLMKGREQADFEDVPLVLLGVILNDWLSGHDVKPLVLSQSFGGVFD